MITSNFLLSTDAWSRIKIKDKKFINGIISKIRENKVNLGRISKIGRHNMLNLFYKTYSKKIQSYETFSHNFVISKIQTIKTGLHTIHRAENISAFHFYKLNSDEKLKIYGELHYLFFGLFKNKLKQKRILKPKNQTFYDWYNSRSQNMSPSTNRYYGSRSFFSSGTDCFISSSEDDNINRLVNRSQKTIDLSIYCRRNRKKLFNPNLYIRKTQHQIDPNYIKFPIKSDGNFVVDMSHNFTILKIINRKIIYLQIPQLENAGNGRKFFEFFSVTDELNIVIYDNNKSSMIFYKAQFSIGIIQVISEIDLKGENFIVDICKIKIGGVNYWALLYGQTNYIDIMSIDLKKKQRIQLGEKLKKSYTYGEFQEAMTGSFYSFAEGKIAFVASDESIEMELRVLK